MCGIAAILAYGAAAGPLDAAELTTIRDAMAVRGPDGAGQWSSADRRVGLAHRRLAILDLSSAGAQPMLSADGRLAITFNGEIYNFAALRAELEQTGTVFRSRTDTEVLLALYRRDGPDMVRQLRGMFAFALWDADRRGLLLARDPFGIKPLYLADDGKCLRIASQVKALLAGGQVDTRPEPAGHAGFFLWGHVPEPFTLYRGIRALPAGSWLWQGLDGSRRAQRYFDATAELAAAAAAPAPAGRADEALRAALLDSVRHHLVSDVPVGVFLSGGRDSTTLAALAAEAGASRLETVTLGFQEFRDTPRDEVPLAEAVARHYGTNQQTHWITAADFAAEREALLAAMDQPTVDGINVYFVARAARRCGLKVALSGLGGDELFAGYDGFRQIPRLVRTLAPFGGLVRPLGHGLRRLAAPLLASRVSPKAAGLAEYGTRFGDAYLLRRALFMPWELPTVLDPDLARAGWQALACREQLAACADPVGSDRLKVSALELQWYMRNQLLRDADWAGMAHSLEIRVPLVDIGLFRALLPLLAGPARPNGGPTKAEMAACARPALPPAVLDRAKTGFFVPVAAWVQSGTAAAERGLRGWARRVYGAAWPAWPA
ncbi:MAG: asparagine synthase (glutamine-hydrolyzing) [Candidatus Hydrogenedens sp.]|nr:asparagine synthase (glutamine-hydrolyzing) [Candidatus Hydrogenedens sp.]